VRLGRQSRPAAGATHTPKYLAGALLLDRLPPVDGADQEVTSAIA
jgi:hypothetical protein